MIAFEITQHNEVEIKSWLERHDKTCMFKARSGQGAVGGRLTYSFSPTDVGVMKKVSCACGAETSIGLNDL